MKNATSPAKKQHKATFEDDEWLDIEEDHSGSACPFMREAIEKTAGVALDVDFSTHLMHFPYMYQAKFKRPMDNSAWDVNFHRSVMKDVFTHLASMPLFHENNIGLCLLDETLITEKTDPSMNEIMPIVEYLWFKKWIPSVVGLMPSKIRYNQRCEYLNLDDRLNRISLSRATGVRFPLYLNDPSPEVMGKAFMTMQPYVDAAFSAGIIPFIQCHFMHLDEIEESAIYKFLSVIERWLDTLENERQEVMLGFSMTDTPIDFTTMILHPNVLKVLDFEKTIGKPDVASHQRQSTTTAAMLNHWVDLMMYNTLTNESLFKHVKDCHRGLPTFYR